MTRVRFRRCGSVGFRWCKRVTCLLVLVTLWLGGGAVWAQGPQSESPSEETTAKKTPAPASTFSFEWSVYGGLRFTYVKNGLDAYTSPPGFNQDYIGGGVLAGSELIFKFNPYVWLQTNFDVGELSFGSTNQNGTSTFGVYLNDYNLNQSNAEYQALQAEIESCKQSAREQGADESQCSDPFFLLQESFFFRQLFATFSFTRNQWSQLRVGMYNAKLGRSFIYNSFALGARLTFNWLKREEKKRLPLLFEIEAFLPDSSLTSEGKMSPVFNTRLSLAYNAKQKISFFATYMYDGNDLAAKLLLPLWQEYFMSFVSDLTRSRAGESISPSCTNGAFTDAEKKAILQSFPRAMQTRIEQQQQAGNDPLDSFYTQMCNRFPSSTGHHVWLGFEGNWEWKGGFFVEGAAILYLSRIVLGLPKGSSLFRPNQRTRFRPPPQPGAPPRGTGTVSQPLVVQQTDSETATQFDVVVEDRNLTGLSFLGELRAGYKWLPTLSTSAFFLFAMGDTFRQNKTTYNAFMGIVPQVRYTNVFFNGGINAYSSKRGLGISGISGKGYIAPGLILEYADGPDYFRKANVKLTGTAYWAVQPSIYKDEQGRSGTFYGAEINVVGGYQVISWLRPVMQVDLFFPGGFFAASSPPPVVFRVLVGLDFLLFG